MTGTDRPRIELYVRSLRPDGAHARQEAVIERLERLEAAGVVESVSVIVWGKQVARGTAGARTDEGEFILNRVAEFTQWALSNNVSLESFHQMVGNESYEAIVLPVMGLAEYRGGELVHVAPCTEGEVVHSIPDRLDRLERGEPAVTTGDGVSILSD